MWTGLDGQQRPSFAQKGRAAVVVDVVVGVGVRGGGGVVVVVVVGGGSSSSSSDSRYYYYY